MDADALACVTTLFQQFCFPIGERTLHDEAKETVVNENDEGGGESAVSHANFKVRVGVGCVVWGKNTAPSRPFGACRLELLSSICARAENQGSPVTGQASSFKSGYV